MECLHAKHNNGRIYGFPSVYPLPMRFMAKNVYISLFKPRKCLPPSVEPCILFSKC